MLKYFGKMKSLIAEIELGTSGWWCAELIDDVSPGSNLPKLFSLNPSSRVFAKSSKQCRGKPSKLETKTHDCK